MKLKAIIIIILAFLCIGTSHPKEEVIFAIDLIRHGARSPFIEVPKDPCEWPEGLGELTVTGMLQTFELGSKFRDLYINQYRLLSSNYNKEEIEVKSTNYQRTIMSAESVLMGMYPSSYRAIHIDILKKPEHKLILLYRDHDQILQSLEKKYVRTTPEWTGKLAKYENKFKEWSKITGLDINNLESLEDLGNNMEIRIFYNLPTPKNISDNDVKDIINLSVWKIVEQYKPYEIGSYLSQDLRSTIKDYLVNAVNKKSPLKYLLLSGHDTTILSLMSGLKMPLNMTPAFASNLKILLLKEKSGDKEKFFIKLHLDDQKMKINKKYELQEFIEMLDKKLEYGLS